MEADIRSLEELPSYTRSEEKKIKKAIKRAYSQRVSLMGYIASLHRGVQARSTGASDPGDHDSVPDDRTGDTPLRNKKEELAVLRRHVAKAEKLAVLRPPASWTSNWTGSRRRPFA